MNKKIEFIIASMSSGGAERQLSQLVSLLDKENLYNISIVTFSNRKDHYNLPESINRVRIIPSKFKFITILKLYKHLLFTNSDIVMSFGQRESAISIFPLLLRPRIKTIAGERNFTTGKASIYEKLLTNILYYRANHIISNNLSQAKYLKSKGKKWCKKVQTITNYTDIDQYRYTPTPCNEKVNIAVFARYSSQKNCIRFIDCLKTLNNNFNYNYHIDWYGQITDNRGNKEVLYTTMLDKIEKYNLQNIISLHDHVRNVAEQMKSYDVICLPSIYEGFSNSLAEAICCGKPVIASDVSDNATMVKDGINGFTFNPYDIDDMRKALINIISCSKDDRTNMGVKSRLIAEKLFNKHEFLNKYISIFES